MNKTIILAIAILCSINSFSQEKKNKKVFTDDVYGVQKEESETDEDFPENLFDDASGGFVYCQLVGTSNFLQTKVTVQIDFGQARKFFERNKRLMDKNGKPIKFNSMVDAMNYMGRMGWEFTQAYVVTIGKQNVYHWLLKKKLETEPTSQH